MFLNNEDKVAIVVTLSSIFFTINPQRVYINKFKEEKHGLQNQGI